MDQHPTGPESREISVNVNVNVPSPTAQQEVYTEGMGYGLKNVPLPIDGPRNQGQASCTNR